MSLIINNFHSNKEIFLWELVSNASNALEKILYERLTDSSRADHDKSIGWGTNFILYFKEDQAEERQVKEVVKKHLQFIGHLITLYLEKEQETEISDYEAEEVKGEKEEEDKDDEKKLKIEDVGSNKKDDIDKNKT
ncbi:Heat shock protein HSP 90-beta [Sciurus carolinensis]|uniref:Heat shock protein HSP 90-beta n=1 Tax=Sciurus carolinensis TaxID=30640 RepID=A0AA41MLJ5_SCICA|nr:Heat shock protein HSP 90-beta [Sciurus carolinensis]